MPDAMLIDIYVRGGRGRVYTAGVGAGLTGEALERFKYAAEEHVIT